MKNIKAIFVIAGHGTKNGNKDNGASYEGLIERNCAQIISTNLSNKLEEIKNINIIPLGIMKNLSLDEKVKKVNDECKKNGYTYENSILIEIHCNSFKDPDVGTGSEALIWNGYAPASDLAKDLLNETVKLNGLKNRGVKDGLWTQIIRETTPLSVLFETAFINTKKDREVLKHNLKSFSDGIYNGLKNYIGFKEENMDLVDQFKKLVSDYEELENNYNKSEKENKILKDKMSRLDLIIHE